MPIGGWHYVLVLQVSKKFFISDEKSYYLSNFIFDKLDGKCRKNNFLIIKNWHKVVLAQPLSLPVGSVGRQVTKHLKTYIRKWRNGLDV